MWGSSEFYPTGSLKDYDRTDQLSKIDHRTLFICGEDDEATPESTKFYASKVPNSEFRVIKNASHLTLLEQPDEYMNIIQEFLGALIE